MEKPEPNEPVGWNENLPNALRHIMYNPQGMLHEEWPQLMESWPAHLHIDILPEFQRKGYGRQLIDMFCDSARKQGAKGVHLGMAAANDEAGKFYARLGFTRFPVVLDNGVSGEQVRTQNTIWLVKSL
jgi:GNAT superfamily N-acetyltransferase